MTESPSTYKISFNSLEDAISKGKQRCDNDVRCFGISWTDGQSSEDGTLQFQVCRSEVVLPASSVSRSLSANILMKSSNNCFRVSNDDEICSFGNLLIKNCFSR